MSVVRILLVVISVAAYALLMREALTRASEHKPIYAVLISLYASTVFIVLMHIAINGGSPIDVEEEVQEDF